jgi:hypothetical protein
MFVDYRRAIPFLINVAILIHLDVLVCLVGYPSSLCLVPRIRFGGRLILSRRRFWRIRGHISILGLVDGCEIDIRAVRETSRTSLVFLLSRRRCDSSSSRNRIGSPRLKELCLRS